MIKSNRCILHFRDSADLQVWINRMQARKSYKRGIRRSSDSSVPNGNLTVEQLSVVGQKLNRSGLRKHINQFAANYNNSQRIKFRSRYKERAVIIDALAAYSDDLDKLCNLINCGRQGWVVKHKQTGRIDIRTSSCMERICPVCCYHRSVNTTDAIRRTLEQAPASKISFITLTLKHNDDSLVDQLDKLKRSFRRLRQQKMWSENVRYGYGVVECKLDESGGQWHPHLHIIACAEYMPQRDLSKGWLRATGDSSYLHIEGVSDRAKAIDYVTKYAAKGIGIMQFVDHKDRLAEYTSAIAGNRLVIKFGKPPKPVLQAPDPEGEEVDKEYDLICTIDELIEQYYAGDESARTVWQSLFPELDPEMLII